MTALFRKLRSASRISFTDWLLFTQAWGWLLFFDLGLRTRPYSALKNFASELGSISAPASEQVKSVIHNLRVAVDRARFNHLYPMTCLRRALTLQKMLAKRGILTELKIGARRKDAQLSAHAWVEYQGQSIGEPEKIREKFSNLEKVLFDIGMDRE